MAQGWTAGRRWGAGTTYQPPLPRTAKAQGREDGAFKPPCAGLETRETGNAVTSGKALLS